MTGRWKFKLAVMVLILLIIFWIGAMQTSVLSWRKVYVPRFPYGQLHGYSLRMFLGRDTKVDHGSKRPLIADNQTGEERGRHAPRRPHRQPHRQPHRRPHRRQKRHANHRQRATAG